MNRTLPFNKSLATPHIWAEWISSYERDLPLNDLLLSSSLFVSLSDGILQPVPFEYAQITLFADTLG